MFPSASAGLIPHSHIHARLDVYTWSLAAGWVALLVVSLSLALSGHYHAEGNAIAGHVLLLLVGLAGIGFGSRNLRRALSSRNAARDALITDVIMPGGHNGLELARQLHSAKPELSIVIISGYSGNALRTTPAGEGATYLAKPFDYETLTQALRTSLARHRR
jgi:CheY-like chemotaxis protein